MKKLPKLTLLLLSPALLTGCAKDIALTADLVCKSWREIRIVKADQITETTASKIEGNNEARKAVGCKSQG